MNPRIINFNTPAPQVDSCPKVDWLTHFNTGIVSAEELHTMELPHHPSLLGGWFSEADLGFIFAARGVGKTHLGLAMARALAEGGNIGPWKAEKAVPVLYVDGEMNAEQIRVRDAALRAGEGELFFLNHEVLFNRTEQTLNLADRERQEALTAVCVERNIRVLFLDNLSTLFTGVAENENDDWEKVLPWLLHLRRLNVAVVMIHHAGRSGTHMRGASRREDAAAWVLRLDDALDVVSAKRGAKFVTVFTKPSRHTAAEVPSLEWEFAPNEATGQCEVTVKVVSSLEVFLQWIRDGLYLCSEIADAMGVSKGTVSKLAKRAMDAGRIDTISRRYVLTDGNEAGTK